MHQMHPTSLVSAAVTQPPPHWACVGSYLCQLAPTACSPCLASAWSREATPRALPCCHSHEEAARLLRQKGQPPHHPPLDRACDGRGLQGVQLPQAGGGCMGVSVSVVPAALSWWLGLWLWLAAHGGGNQRRLARWPVCGGLTCAECAWPAPAPRLPGALRVTHASPALLALMTPPCPLPCHDCCCCCCRHCCVEVACGWRWLVCSIAGCCCGGACQQRKRPWCVTAGRVQGPQRPYQATKHHHHQRGSAAHHAQAPHAALHQRPRRHRPHPGQSVAPVRRLHHRGDAACCDYDCGCGCGCGYDCDCGCVNGARYHVSLRRLSREGGVAAGSVCVIDRDADDGEDDGPAAWSQP